MTLRLPDHTEVLHNIATSSSFFSISLGFSPFLRAYFELQNFWSLRNLIKQLFHSRLLDIRPVIANSYPTRGHGIIVNYSWYICISNYDIRPQTSLMTQGTHLRNDSFSLHIGWIYIYICSGMVDFKVNVIFMIKICAVDKNRSEANFSDASRFSSYSLYVHAREMRKWEG